MEFLEPAAAAFGVVLLIKPLILRKLHEDWINVVVLVIAILYGMVQLIANGESLVDAVLNGILGGITAVIVYRGINYEQKKKEAQHVEFAASEPQDFEQK